MAHRPRRGPRGALGERPRQLHHPLLVRLRQPGAAGLSLESELRELVPLRLQVPRQVVERERLRLLADRDLDGVVRLEEAQWGRAPADEREDQRAGRSDHKEQKGRVHAAVIGSTARRLESRGYSSGSSSAEPDGSSAGTVTFSGVSSAGMTVMSTSSAFLRPTRIVEPGSSARPSTKSASGSSMWRWIA